MNKTHNSIDGINELNRKLRLLTDRLYANSNPTLLTVTSTVSADTDIIPAVAGKKIKVVAYSLTTTNSNANTITFKSNASTSLWAVKLQSPADVVTGANLSIAAPSYLFSTNAGEKLTLDVSAAEEVTYSITYFV
jgi:hypothetical protein